MELSVTLSDHVAEQLAAKAKLAGVDLSTYVGAWVDAVMTRPPLTAKEISGEMASDFEASGMTDDELGDFLEVEKHAMRGEKRGREEYLARSAERAARLRSAS